MKKFAALMMLGTSIAAVAASADAQTASPATATPAAATEGQAAQPGRADMAGADTTGVQPEREIVPGDIVVTARRRNESLQDVPQTINVVSSETVEKLNILRFEDVSSVIPGLTLSSGNGGVNPSASLRGVTFRVDSSAPPTVALYLNEAPVNAGFLFQSVFDLGQIEVLRGPQGTLRGVSAPSGSITVTTRRPDTQEAGGYVNMTGSSRGAINGQGALNLPVIGDVLAVRVAGVVDQNQSDGVTSVNNRTEPYNKTVGGRVSVLLRPSSDFTATVVYQHLDQKLRNFRQVIGTGAVGGGSANTAAGYNGPTISGSDRLAISDGANTARQTYDIVTGQADWTIGSQRLSYVGSYVNSDSRRISTADYANQILNYERFESLTSKTKDISQEIRLASVDPIGIFDYTIGGFYSRSKGNFGLGGLPGAFLDGTFGRPGAPSPAIFDNRYVLPLEITGTSKNSEISAFANVTMHISSRTELSLGGRYVVSSKSRSATSGSIGAAQVAVNVPVPAGFCTAIGALGSTYAGSCDFGVPVVGEVISANNRQKDSPLLYTASLSHRFSDDFLVYGNTGSSFRRGPNNSIGLTNSTNDPVINSFIFLPNEKSKSYEVGFKSTMLDRRLRFNAAAFHQEFKNYFFRTLPTPYLASSGQAQNVVTTVFTAGIDAVVDGIDLDATFQMTKNFSIGGAFSYADSRIDNDLAPCRDANFDGTPDSGTPTVAQFLAAGKSIALCQSNQSIAQTGPWNLSVQSEYAAPISDKVDGFVRGLYNYVPRNSRISENFTARAYGILNAYVGIRSPEGAWEVAAFAKNALNTQRLLSQDFGSFDYSGLSTQFGSSGYTAVSYTPRREFGLNIRYMFGSR